MRKKEKEGEQGGEKNQNIYKIIVVYFTLVPTNSF
jgi:hypothetical protein